MGFICGPPLDGLCESIARDCGVTTFVETGTHRGNTARWAAGRFARVVTVEAVHETFAATREACRDLANVEFHHGDSAAFLPALVPTLTEPCLFWLDAHAGGGNFGDRDVCPLLAEIAAINLSPLPHYVLIDDARAFVATCPPPFVADVWPSLDEIIPALVARHPHHVVCINDAIIAVPPAFRRALQEFCIRIRPTI